MLADRNKSQLTHDITKAAQQWLDNHGFKPVETEVYCGHDTGKGWYADLAAIIHPTQTELVEMKLIPRPPRYEYGKMRNNDGYKEKREAWEKLREVVDRRMTCLVEVKATRDDFRGDRKWTVEPPVDLAYLAIPAGVIKSEHWPKGWGILELRGNVVYQVRVPTPRIATLQQHFTVVYNIALRRDHRTRHATTSEWMKERRMEDAERISMDRIDNIIQAVSDIAAGKTRWGHPVKTVEEALIHHGIRNAKALHIERLATIFGIAAKKERV